MGHVSRFCKPWCFGQLPFDSLTACAHFAAITWKFYIHSVISEASRRFYLTAKVSHCVAATEIERDLLFVPHHEGIMRWLLW